MKKKEKRKKCVLANPRATKPIDETSISDPLNYKKNMWSCVLLHSFNNINNSGILLSVVVLISFPLIAFQGRSISKRTKSTGKSIVAPNPKLRPFIEKFADKITDNFDKQYDTHTQIYIIQGAGNKGDIYKYTFFNKI